MPFGPRSHWEQPWRSYLDTVPATTLLNAIGINFNVYPAEAAATARLLADSGFKRARIEVGWNSLDYADPSTLNERDRTSLATILTAFRENGIRPLILLNANAGEPCPVTPDIVHLVSPANVGATEIHLAPEDVASVIPGHTGISFSGVAARQLIASISPDGTAQMSTPLMTSYPAGELKLATLRYEPFRQPVLKESGPNPRFEKTMLGWLNYVGVVTREVKALLGSDNFDVEVWNELSFGSSFLNINNYYSPPLEGPGEGLQMELLTRTIDYLHDPANGVPDVQVGNGFASQRPWDSGAWMPLGLAAIDKHPYQGWVHFPPEHGTGNRPLNGLGEPSGWQDSEGQWHETFTPEYDAFFPEYPLTGIETETLIHDLAPYPTLFGGVEHGRFTHPEGGAPPTMWITEVNMEPSDGPVPAKDLSTADMEHINAKDVLRYLTSYVNKGVTAIDFYAVHSGSASLVPSSFFEALAKSPHNYPGDALGGVAMEAVHRLVTAMAGAEPIDIPRELSLRRLTSFTDNIQFEGDSADPKHFPPLYNREVFAFFPFQVTKTKFVIPVYAMTRDVMNDYDPSSTEPSRFDLPSEPYELAIAGVDGNVAAVTASDPLTGLSVPVHVVGRFSDEVVIKVPVTDSPRLLQIEEHQPSERLLGTSHPADSTSASHPNASPRAVLRLFGVRQLPRRRSLKALVQCGSSCQLRVRGALRISGRSFRMAAKPRPFVESTAQSHVTLHISRSTASALRLAIHRGARTSALVTARGVGTFGRSVMLRRRVQIH